MKHILNICTCENMVETKLSQSPGRPGRGERDDRCMKLSRMLETENEWDSSERDLRHSQYILQDMLEVKDTYLNLEHPSILLRRPDKRVPLGRSTACNNLSASNVPFVGETLEQ